MKAKVPAGLGFQAHAGCSDASAPCNTHSGLAVRCSRLSEGARTPACLWC